jgi:hypothetical protein
MVYSNIYTYVYLYINRYKYMCVRDNGSTYYVRLSVMAHPVCCVCAVCTASRTPNEVETRCLPEIREEENG